MSARVERLALRPLRVHESALFNIGPMELDFTKLGFGLHFLNHPGWQERLEEEAVVES